MSKIFPTLPGIPLSKEEDENLCLWKHLQNHSRDIVSNAIALVQSEGPAKLFASMNLQNAVKNYLRLGGKPEEIKHFL